MARGQTLYIAMVGLPAMGKSTVAAKLKENLEKEDIRIRIFNNGEVRRRMLQENTSHSGFYNPGNAESAAMRERIAAVNMAEARAFISEGGHIAILDATNVSRKRREVLSKTLEGHPILFIECVNEDRELLDLSVARKIRTAEFAHLTPEAAKASFVERIGYYRHIYEPPLETSNNLRVETLSNRIVRERLTDALPYYSLIRDLLVSDWIKNLFLVRHGQSEDNLTDRIGGDSGLTEKGRAQAWALSRHFIGTPIPYLFTSTKRRALEMAAPLLETREHCIHHAFGEFDEIDAGVCEGLTYAEARTRMPEVCDARGRDKYHYRYPDGEGYAVLAARVDRGIKKALFLSGNSDHIMIIGHQAVNRTILSHFLFRRTEDVPYIHIPQDKFFHIVSTQSKKLFELRKFQPT